MTSAVYSLLGLPTEIRQQIYSYLLISDQPLTIYTYCPPYRPSNGIHPAILRTCKTTHIEAMSLLYNFNIFRLDFNLRHIPHYDANSNAYLPFFIQHIAKCVKKVGNFNSSKEVVFLRGTVTHDTLRKMKHIEIEADFDTRRFCMRISDRFSKQGRLLLEILEAIGGGQKWERSQKQDLYRATLRIHKKNDRSGSGWFDVPAAIRNDKVSRYVSGAEMVGTLERISLARHFEIVSEDGTAEDYNNITIHNWGRGATRVSQASTAINDFVFPQPPASKVSLAKHFLDFWPTLNKSDP